MAVVLKRFWSRFGPALGMGTWVVGAAALAVYGRSERWGPGEFVLAGAVWFGLLAFLARDAVRNMFGPVFWYEALRLGRRKSTFILRLAYVVFLLFLLTVLYLGWRRDIGYFSHVSNRVPPALMAEFAAHFFESFAIIQLVVVALLTPAYVAASITNEKERKTLEFLLATDLRNREIVFGKLAARVINLLMYVLAGLPVIAFLQLFGGIDPDLALASAAAAMISVFGAASVSILMSCLCRRSRDAIVLSYVTIIVYIVVSGLVAGLVRFNLPSAMSLVADFGHFTIDLVDITDWIAAGNLLYSFPVNTQGGRTLDPNSISIVLGQYAVFWGVVCSFTIGLALMGLRAWGLAEVGGRANRITNAREMRARPEIGDDPIFWREVFVGSTRRTSVFGWFFRSLIVLLLVGIPIYAAWQIFIQDITYPFYERSLARQWYEYQENMNAYVRVLTGVLSVVILIGTALRAASSVAGERDKDTWISLISTPLTAWDILRGKWLGSVLGMRGAYLILLLGLGFGLAIGALHVAMVVALLLHLAVYVSAFAWVGLYCGTRARSGLRANMLAFFVSLFLLGGYMLLPLFCCCFPWQIIESISSRTTDQAIAILAAFSPPFMCGYLPIMELTSRQLEPFDLDRPRSVGPIAPFMGFIGWILFTLLAGALTYRKFLSATNRAVRRKASAEWPPESSPTGRARAKRVEVA